MDIWNYLEIVRNKNQGWLFHKDNLEERLFALTKISEMAHPATICYLIPHLKDRNKEIRNAACSTIVSLFAKINTQNGYYNSLKNCDISKSDIDFFAGEFEQDQCLDLLLIASLNRNGHVREKAVYKLTSTNNDKVLQFIIYRLADWVPIVQHAALQGIVKYKKPEHIDAFVENLPIFEWLQKVERVDLSSIYNGIVTFIVAENIGYVRDNFGFLADKTRLLLAKHLSESPVATVEDVQLLLNDTHFLIRSLAVDHHDKLSPKQISCLLNDKSKRVRLRMLRELQVQNDFNNIAFSFLADTSASIRQFARFSLGNEGLDFPKIYNNNIAENREVVGSLSGLAETGGKQFSKSVEHFLYDEKVKIRKLAFLALTKLNQQRAYEFALANMDSEFIGIRNLVIDFLRMNANSEVLERAREIYKSGEVDSKHSMLKLFDGIGGWTTIADIVTGTVDENQDIRNRSVRYLQMWKARAAKLFTQPKADEIDRAKKAFSCAFEVHESKGYFSENPLSGLDFYLR